MVLVVMILGLQLRLGRRVGEAQPTFLELAVAVASFFYLLR